MKMLGPLQLRIMKVMWKIGDEDSIDVKTVTARLNARGDDWEIYRPLAYSTILTVVRTLYKMEFLNREMIMSISKSHFYYPIISKEQYQRFIVEELLRDVFDGNARILENTIFEISGVKKNAIQTVYRYRAL